MLTLSLIAALVSLTILGVVALPWTDAELEGSVEACLALREGALQVRATNWVGEAQGARAVEAVIAR